MSMRRVLYTLAPAVLVFGAAWARFGVPAVATTERVASGTPNASTYDAVLIGPDATPTPQPKGVKRETARATLPAPVDLASTTDPQVCSRHLGNAQFLDSFICQAIGGGTLTLVWEWPGKENIAGYRIYRVDGGRRERVHAQANGKEVMVDLLKAPVGGFSGKCYAVVAYKGKLESDLSNPFCVGGGRVLQAVTLDPDHRRCKGKIRDGYTGVAGRILHDGDLWNCRDEVGFYYRTDKSSQGDYFDNQIYRSGVHFDLDSLKGKKIWSAKLKLTVDTSHVGNGSETNHHTSCVARIATGIDRWWKYSDWIDMSLALEPDEANGPDVSYDVTKIVRGWVSGAKPNFGFVLLGSEENLNAFAEKACYTSYASIQLEVKHD